MTSAHQLTEARPAPVNKARQTRKKRVWTVVGTLLALLLAAAGLRVYGTLSLYASGEAVDIGGRQIFIRCSGTGSPTVILEHGLGSNGFEWETVQDSIDDTNRVCYTSRAGMGFSDAAPSDTKRTAQDAADDLAAVLTASDVSGPYIVVGHSFGGPIVRLFAAQHPDEVVGMVLVDSTHEDLTARVREQMSPAGWAEVSKFLLAGNPENMDLEASNAQVAATRGTVDIPLVVLQAGDQDSDGAPPGVSKAAVEELETAMAAIGTELQRDLATLSRSGRYELVEGSGHFIQVDRPDAVIDAINSILDR